MKYSGRSLIRVGGGDGLRPGQPLRVGECARGPRVSPGGPPEEGSTLRRRVRAPKARVQRPTAPRWAGASGPGGSGVALMSASCGPAFMPDDPAGMETCNECGLKGGAGGRPRTSWSRPVQRGEGVGRGGGEGMGRRGGGLGGGGGQGASFLWGGRAVECQLSYFKPFTGKNPGPNRRQLPALPLQSFLWTRGATEERPRGWKSGWFGTRGDL